MKCDYCNKVGVGISRDKERWQGDMCDECQFHIFGFVKDRVFYNRKWTDGDIFLWIKENKAVYAWVDNGNTTVPKSIWKDKAPVEVIWKLRENKFYCSICEKPLNNEEIALRHIAGIYCDKCAGEYKKEHSGKCRICGEPRWECGC